MTARAGVVIAVVLASLGPAFAEEPLSAPVTLLIHSVQSVRVPEVLAERCGVDRPIRGCSRFFGRRLHASCTGESGQWQLLTRAEFAVVSYLGESAALQHEHLHITDVRRDVEDFVTEIKRRSYESETACDLASAELRRTFPAVMNQMQRNSNAWRHPAAPVARIAATP